MPPGRFKWTRLFRRKTKSGFCACYITFQTQSTDLVEVTVSYSWSCLFEGEDCVLEFVCLYSVFFLRGKKSRNFILVAMLGVFYFCVVFNKSGIWRNILSEIADMNFRKNSGCGRRRKTGEVMELIIIIIIFFNCNWVVTRWHWLFYMYTKCEIGY